MKTHQKSSKITSVFLAIEKRFYRNDSIFNFQKPPWGWGLIDGEGLFQGGGLID